MWAGDRQGWTRLMYLPVRGRFGASHLRFGHSTCWHMQEPKAVSGPGRELKNFLHGLLLLVSVRARTRGRPIRVRLLYPLAHTRARWVWTSWTT